MKNNILNEIKRGIEDNRITQAIVNAALDEFDKMSPLLLAIKLKVHDIARLIITEVKADPDARDKNENTALHIAA